MPSSRRLIASQTLSTTAASVTFSSIPAGYRDLVVKVSVRSTFNGTDPTNTARLGIRLNGDESLSTVTDLYGTGTSVVSSRANATNYAIAFQGTDTTSNTFGSADIYLPSYLSNQFKPHSTFAATENNATGTAFVSTTANLWRNTTAVNSLSFFALFGQIAAGSSFYLYGLLEN